MRINNNIAAANTYRQYSTNISNSSKSMEKLSSGLRINRAGDDAAGLAISEKMRSQIRGIKMASKNSQDAISLVQTAEGALNETHSILQRMNELAVQSASDTNVSIDRTALNEEFAQLKLEVDDIANKTSFNTKKLLNGDFGNSFTKSYSAGTTASAGAQNAIMGDGFTIEGAFTAGTIANFDYTAGSTSPDTLTFTNGGNTYTVSSGVAGADSDFSAGVYDIMDASNNKVGTLTLAGSNIGTLVSDDASYSNFSITVTGNSTKIQTGADATDTLALSIKSMNANKIGIVGSDNLSTALISSQTDASDAITIVNKAINDVSTQRANLGAIQNRLDHKINNLNTSSENLQASESRIRDVDMAQEMIEFTKNNILQQAAQSMLSQANAQPQGVLQLLK